MREGPDISQIAALIGDPGRANMLTALMRGMALTASELALEANVTLPTASGHLTKLETANIVSLHKQGRHNYYHLEDDIPELLETLMGAAAKRGLLRFRPGPKDNKLRKARICYDHLAGNVAVRILDMMEARKLVAIDNDKKDQKTLILTDNGVSFFTEFGIDIEQLTQQRRPICRRCLDWSERRCHLAGGLGAAILSRIFDLEWAKREEDSRVIMFTEAGISELSHLFSTPMV